MKNVLEILQAQLVQAQDRKANDIEYHREALQQHTETQSRLALTIEELKTAIDVLKREGAKR